jgi:hypothetical protein
MSDHVNWVPRCHRKEPAFCLKCEGAVGKLTATCCNLSNNRFGAASEGFVFTQLAGRIKTPPGVAIAKLQRPDLYAASDLQHLHTPLSFGKWADRWYRSI